MNPLEWVQTVLLVVGAALALINLRKLGHSRNVDFVINAEARFDETLMHLSDREPTVIRRVYGRLLPDDIADVDVVAWLFFYAMYVHIARMYFILGDSHLDLGMSRDQRNQLVSSWLKYLSIFKDDPLLLSIHQQALKNRDFNDRFLDTATRILATPTSA